MENVYSCVPNEEDIVCVVCTTNTIQVSDTTYAA